MKKEHKREFTLRGLLVILVILVLLVIVALPLCQARLDAAASTPSPYEHAAYAEARVSHESRQDYGG